MSARTPSKTELGHEGISFANALQDVLACGVILVDALERVTSLNDEARQMLGLAAGVESSASRTALPGPLQRLIHESLFSAKSLSGSQVDIKTLGGRLTTLRVTTVLLRSDPAAAGLALVINDLSTARKLDETLLHVDRLASLGTLSAGMAHEIRNALVAGKTCFDLLFEKHQDAELVDVARREIRRIEAIVSRMLKFVGTTETTFGELNLHEALEHSLRLVQPQLEDKLISVERSFQAARDRVRGDDLQLQQAFVNLFLNALEAMGASGTLTVATELISRAGGRGSGTGFPAGAQISLTIQDTGAGIPAEHLTRLFEPFFTTKASGTGLGLPITRRIIQEHRGDITVQSEPNKGTTFRIVLPVLEKPS
jgi:two-component system, NtrC family, nitrogen regulation sensor histidine kinase GlnL